MRHRLPAARIVCTDFEDARLPNVEAALDIEFHAGDFNALLAANEGRFDVMFSNHVLEHLFDPERTLKLTKRALAAEGRMIAALPLDGQPSTPFSSVLDADDCMRSPCARSTMRTLGRRTSARSSSGSRQRASGMLSSLRATESSQWPSGSFRTAAFERRAKLGMLLNRALFASTRGSLERVFPRQVPRLVLKAVFGIERRVWFGSNRLKNDFSLECLIVARRENLLVLRLSDAEWELRASHTA